MSLRDIVSGAKGSALVFPAVGPSDLGRYRVVVSNAKGWAISPEVVLAFAGLTEANAVDWYTFVSDGASASTADDATHVKLATSRCGSTHSAPLTPG